MNSRFLVQPGFTVRHLSAALLAFTIAACPARADHHQYALDAAPNVTIRSSDLVSFQQFAPTPDGKVLASGSFNYVNGVECPLFVRLQPTGDLDSTFSPATDGVVFRCAVTPTGAIWCASPFGTGPTPYQIIRLNADGSRDESIAPIPLDSNFVRDLILLPDGGLYLIDGFGGGTRVQRFTATGELDSSFATINVPSFAQTWAVNATGEIALVGFGTGPSSVTVYDPNGVAEPIATAAIPSNFGVFGAVYDDAGALVLTGQTHGPSNPVLIRILPGGALDPTFSGVTPFSQVGATKLIRLSDGELVTLAIVGFGGPNSILEFSPAGVFERSLPISGTNGATPNNLALQSLGADYLLSGQFATVNGIAVSQVARIDASGAVESNFHAQFLARGQINAIVPPASGGLLVGGDFTDVGGQTAGGLAAMASNGTLDLAFPRIAFGAHALIPTADGGVVVLGGFPAFAGTSTNGLVKLRSDRTPDTSFLSGINLFGFQTGLGLADGSVLLGGSFGNFTGQSWPASFLARVLPDGSLDPAFNNHSTLTGGSGLISALAIDGSSRILVAGSFTEFQGAMRPGLARTDANGNVDSTFVPPVGLSANGLPGDLRVLSDGRFFVRGVPGNISAPTPPTLLRFNADGTIDSTFAPAFGSAVTAYSIASDGTIYAATAGPSARLLRLSQAGDIDSSFSFELDSPATALAIDSNGAIVVGGRFTTINGVRRESLARLIPVPLGVTIDGPATLDVRLLSTVTLTADVVSAGDDLTFQWFHDGCAIDGATSATLTLTHLVPKDSGAYTVVVTSGGETAKSAAVDLRVQPGNPHGP